MLASKAADFPDKGTPAEFNLRAETQVQAKSDSGVPLWANPDIWSNGFALLALLVAAYSLRQASRANKLASTNAWAQEPTKLLAEETESNAADAAAFLALLGSPIPSTAKKDQLLEVLRQQRDESTRRVSKLMSLAPTSRFLMDLKAARDSENDSFFSNHDLDLPQARREALLSEFVVVQQRYGNALRRFALDLVEEELLDEEALPKKLKDKYLKR